MKYMLFICAVLTHFASASAQSVALESSADLFYEIEMYNDMDVTHTVIDFYTGDYVKELVKVSSTCGADKMNDFQYYNPVDETQTIAEMYSVTAALQMKALLDAGLITADEYQALAVSLEAQTRVLAAYLEGKVLGLCTEYSSPAYSDGHTEYYVMVDGEVKFVMSVGHPD